MSQPPQDDQPTEKPIDTHDAEQDAKVRELQEAVACQQSPDPWVEESRVADDARTASRPGTTSGAGGRAPAPPSLSQREPAPAHALTPTILARCDVVTVLVGAPFDAWYDQWMLQVDAADDAVDPAGVDYFDDAVRMLEPAAIGMATVALRAHLDAHQAAYAAAGVMLLVEPLAPQHGEIVCLLGVLETMHEEGEGWREDGELSFVATVEQYALMVPAYRDDDLPFPIAIFAPGDPFFSAVDMNTAIGNATLADVKAHPEQYALVDVQVTALYAHLALLARDADESGSSDVALTA